MDVDTWIERWLDRFPFVQWDRYLDCECNNGDFTRVYGWIDRDHDSYKDFVVLDFLHWQREVVYICSSSSEYSDQICRIIDGDDTEHNPYKRVEDRFTVENMVTLQPKATDADGTTR